MSRAMRNLFVRILPLLLLAWLLVACGGTDTVTEPLADAAPAAVVEPTEVPLEEMGETDDSEASTETVEAGADEPGAENQTSDGSLAGLRVLTIDPEQSEARFLVNEVLLGEDKTVVGVTSLVTGAISVDPADPTSTEISAIIIDARDLKTDSSRRNRSIQRQILRSAADENRYITFEPTAIDDLPQTATIDEPFSFTVTGDLTVRGETRSETFELSVTPMSSTEITGLATTVIRYEDYGISIPSVPAVASVEDEVRLELAFVAVSTE